MSFGVPRDPDGFGVVCKQPTTQPFHTRLTQYAWVFVAHTGWSAPPADHQKIQIYSDTFTPASQPGWGYAENKNTGKKVWCTIIDPDTK